MPYYTDDGDEIDPNDIPVPGLCRLCTQYLDPDTDPDRPGAAGGERALAQSMQIVHCTLTRLDHYLDSRRNPSSDCPFTCHAFRSRFGSDAIWH